MKKILAITAFSLFLAGIGVGRWVVPSPSLEMQALGRGATDGIDTNDYPRTWRLIKDKHVNTEITDAELFYSSVNGLVEALDDPYSVFLSPKEAEIDGARMQGSFAGIGVEIGQKEGRVTVIAAIEGSPAAKAGLQAGDVILEANGTELYKMKLNDVVHLIRGEIGKPVTLTIYRDGFPEPKEITVVRDRIVVKPVKWRTEKRGKKTIMVVTISQFVEDTAKQFEKAVEEATETGVNGMVIDLRNNPGGMLNVALDVISNWATEVPLVIMEPRDEPPEALGRDYDAPLANMPTVILINKGSASASEIMTGALQDHGKAYAIGETTFGKGCGQTLFEYPDGAELRLTTFLWKTPKGRTIDKTGIAPDEMLKADPKDIAAGKDVQMDRALQYLLNGR